MCIVCDSNWQLRKRKTCHVEEKRREEERRGEEEGR
jgi:hypothetical protein